MKTLVCKTIFVLFLLFVPNARADSQVEFRLARKFMIVVSVTVNDKEKLDFLLDTGTNSTVVAPDIAEKLNLRPRDRHNNKNFPRPLQPRLPNDCGRRFDSND